MVVGLFGSLFIRNVSRIKPVTTVVNSVLNIPLAYSCNLLRIKVKLRCCAFSPDIHADLIVAK